MIVDGNSVNKANPDSIKTRSHIDLSHHHFMTPRFGQYSVPYVDFVIPSDKSFKFSSRQNVRTYTLKGPLMQRVNYNKDNFLVPLSAILPRNWEKVYTNPVQGDDIPNNGVGTTVYGVCDKLGTIHSNFKTYLRTALDAEQPDVDSIWTAIMRYMIFMERFFSNGSLLAQMNCHLSNNFRYQYHFSLNGDFAGYRSFDNLSDFICSEFQSAVSDSTFANLYATDGNRYIVSALKDRYGDYNDNFVNLTPYEALEVMRDVENFYFEGLYSEGLGYAENVYTALSNCTIVVDEVDTPFDIMYPVAYHLVCKHFFTNDHVDNVYSAELYREVIGHYILSVYESLEIGNDTFNYNGLECLYDYLSGHYFEFFLNTINSRLPSQTWFGLNFNFKEVFGYFRHILGFDRSLRYMDYFVGARTNPLAVGDVTTPVTSAGVSVIDVTKNIQFQRFLNAVNRFGRKSKSYIEGLFGVNEGYDYTNPSFVSHTSDELINNEVENTADAQQENNNSVTSVMRANSERFEFEVDINRPSVAISILSFDIARIYTDSIDKHFFIEDRFDMFVPQLQFVGDQAVSVAELTGVLKMYDDNFAYQLRDAQFKQKYNFASGGFKEYLPGYSFAMSPLPLNIEGTAGRLSEDFIRAKTFELDNLYLSLTNRSLAGYFHFIVDCYCKVDVSRPMVVAPSIL